VYGKNKADHDKTLHTVLTKLTDYNVTLNDKCIFEVPSIQVLGHVIDSKGMHPNPDLVKVIAEAPVPENKEQLHSFLGLAGYYAKFIDHFADKVEVLRNVFNADSFHWTTEANKSFIAIKNAISDSNTLGLFDPALEVIVTTDASSYGLGAVLTQIRNGEHINIAFSSRTLRPNETKFSVGEKEALACVWAVEHWHTYLWGRKFTLQTDHKALTTLMSAKGCNNHAPMRIARWNARLLHYNYDIVYTPDVLVADVLSRLPLACECALPYCICNENDNDAVCIIADVDVNSMGVTLDELRNVTNTDTTFCKLKRYIDKGWPAKRNAVDDDVKPFFQVRHDLSISDDIIYRYDRVLCPNTLTHKLIITAHESHQGIVRTKQRLRQLFWWPNMDNDVNIAIKHCTICNRSDKSCYTRKGPMISVPFPAKPWQKLGMDIVGPNNSVANNARFAITLIDYYSKWPEVAFVSDISSRSVIEFLLAVFSREGYPDEIVTDHGSQFTSPEFETFLSSRKIKHGFSAIYHPQANGEIERFNKVLNDCVQIAKLEGKDVKSAVREFLCIYRCTPHASTEHEPSLLLHNRHMMTKLDILGATTCPKPVSDAKLRKHIDDVQTKSRNYVNNHRSANNTLDKIHVGSYVRIKLPGYVPKGHNKLL
jgi:hypothetical protein